MLQGDASGPWAVSKANWVGVVHRIPRASLTDPEFIPDPTLSGSGVYVLVGESDNGVEHLYVGESDNLIKRWRAPEHLAREWWTHAIAVVALDNRLSKSDLHHLEARLIGLIRDLSAGVVENGNAGYSSALAPAARDRVEAFLADVLTVLPMAGVRSVSRPPVDAGVTSHHIFKITGSAQAKGRRVAAGFEVLAGSASAPQDKESFRPADADRRDELVAAGAMELGARGEYRWLRDVTYASPSAAARAVLRRSASGPDEWKSSDGKSMKEYEESAIS